MKIARLLTHASLAVVGGISLALVATPAWARVYLDIQMTMGLSVNPDYWYVVALSQGGSPGPRANLTDPNVTLGVDDVAFVEDWDYLIRVQLLNDEGVLRATIQEPGFPEEDFLVGFNELDLDTLTREDDTIRLSIDLDSLDNLDARNDDVQVSLITIESPFLLEADETNIALDSVRGDFPNYYRMSLDDNSRIVVDDPKRQETLRRSRQLLNDEDIQDVVASSSIEASSLGILAANILTFELEVVDR